MSKQIKLLKPNYDVLRGTVIIDLHENCNTLRVEAPKGQPPLGFQEIVGALEIARLHFAMNQIDYNRKFKAKKALS